MPELKLLLRAIYIQILVYRTEEKNVLLTLMDLARLASRFGLSELPELVRMEREIEALETAAVAAGITQIPTTTATMTTRNPKADIGVYAIRLADRKAISSPERSSSSVSSDLDFSSYDSSISSASHFCSTATFTTTEAFLDQLTDVDEEGRSLEVRTKADSSTLVNATVSTIESGGWLTKPTKYF